MAPTASQAADARSVPSGPVASGTDLGGLAAAFHTFSQSSHRLEQAYRLLLARVHQVDQQLHETNQRLHRKVDELDSLTRYLNDILASMHSGVVGVDAAGRVTSFNRAAGRALGVEAAAALGKPHEEVLANADSSPTPLALSLATGQGAEGVEREVSVGEGKRLCLSSSVAPIRNARGELVGAVEIFRDLTEFRELQERLDRADKLAALGQMAAQVAHEIRNPLNSIEGFATLLLRDLDPGDKRRAFARHVVTGSRSLNKIVTNMLLFSKPFALQPRTTSLRAIVDEALAFVVEEAAQQGRGAVDVERHYDPQADLVEADPDLLRQALMNLMLNAVQAMARLDADRPAASLRVATAVVPAPGTPPGAPEAAHGGEAGGAGAQRSGREVEWACPERSGSEVEWVQIRIEDSGPGIPEHVRDKVLEPFVSTGSKGTGLGLAIVQKIARRHGGRLELVGDAGRGTTALLTLPRRARGATHPAQPR